MLLPAEMSRQTKCSDFAFHSNAKIMNPNFLNAFHLIGGLLKSTLSILPKNGGPGSPDSANFLDFLPNFRLITRNPFNLHCVETVMPIFS